MIYPLCRRRYDPAVVGWTNEVPMKRFIVVAAGVASLLLFRSQALGGQRHGRSRRGGRDHRRQPQWPLGQHPRLVHRLTWISSVATAEGPVGAFCRYALVKAVEDYAA
jgi:hypothetical protein